VAADTRLREAWVEAFSSPVGDATKLLDVEVDEFAWPPAFVPEHRPGCPVHHAEHAEAATPEHTVDGRACHPQLPGEAVWARAQLATERADGGDHILAKGVRQVLRPAAAVLQSGQPLFPEAPPPLRHGGTGETEPAGYFGLAEAIFEQLDDRQATCRGELGVRMGHWGLR
jgi:hypothetical protein